MWLTYLARTASFCRRRERKLLRFYRRKKVGHAGYRVSCDVDNNEHELSLDCVHKSVELRKLSEPKTESIRMKLKAATEEAVMCVCRLFASIRSLITGCVTLLSQTATWIFLLP